MIVLLFSPNIGAEINIIYRHWPLKSDNKIIAFITIKSLPYQLLKPLITLLLFKITII